MATENNPSISTGGWHDIKSNNKYFIKGWWTDMEDKPITEACIGDTVKFHIKTENIPIGEKISVQIMDYWPSPFVVDEKIEINHNEFIVSNNGLVQFGMTIGKACQSRIKKNERALVYSLSLYVRCSYKAKRAELSNEKKSRLEVTYPPKQDKLRFVSASQTHVLPGIYDAITGEIYYITINDIKSPDAEEYELSLKKTAKDSMKVRKVLKIARNMYGDRSYTFAIRQFTPQMMIELQNRLKQGMKRLSDIYKHVQDLVVEKGSKMLEIEYVKTPQSGGVGLLTKKNRAPVGRMFKVGKSLTRNLYLVEMAAFTLDVTNGKRELPIPLPMFTDYFRQLDRDLLEMGQQRFMNKMVSAIVEGYKVDFKIEKGINAMKFFFSSAERYLKEEERLGFRFIPLKEEGLNMIFSGAIAGFPTKIMTENGEELNINDLNMLQYIGQGDYTCGILVQKVEGTIDDRKQNNRDYLDEYDRILDIYNIMGIWLTDLIEEE